MKRILSAAAGPVSWLALIGGLLVAFVLLPRPGPGPTPADPDSSPAGLASPANDVSRRYEMQQEINELRGRVEALEESR